MVAVGLYVALQAKTGKKEQVATFLHGALRRARQEERTTARFAMRTGPPEFAIFDAFGGEAGRDAHLADQVAAVLMTHAAEPLAEPPTIAKVENIADKLPLGEPTPGAAWR